MSISLNGIPPGNPASVPAADDVFSRRIWIVNVCFVGKPGWGNDWVLVDAGVGRCESAILREAIALYGHTRPKAIVLTHGHFDHVGALGRLADYWDVPVYVHEREMPYVTGQADYPPPDPTVGGGLLSRLSFLYPHSAIDIGSRAEALPADGSVPALPGWRWLPTPGHTEGHISLFRDADRTLIAGDAFVTVKQESAFSVLIQRPEMHGPPAYFTPDWTTARESVRRLRELNPAAAATGHGLPMAGEPLSRGLEELVRHFDREAVPEDGRYLPS